MNASDRFQLIKDQTVILWLTFGRKLDPENDGRHLALVQDYDEALRRVPNGKLIGLFRDAKRFDKRPTAFDMAKMWRPDTSKELDRVEPFRPNFREWLSDTAAMADFMYYHNKDRKCLLIAEVCDQAHMKSLGTRDPLEGMSSTQNCINLMYDWFCQVEISTTTSTEVARMVKLQKENRYDGVKDLTILTKLPNTSKTVTD